MRYPDEATSTICQTNYMDSSAPCPFGYLLFIRQYIDDSMLHPNKYLATGNHKHSNIHSLSSDLQDHHVRSATPSIAWRASQPHLRILRRTQNFVHSEVPQAYKEALRTCPLSTVWQPSECVSANASRVRFTVHGQECYGPSPNHRKRISRNFLSRPEAAGSRQRRVAVRAQYRRF